MDRWCGRGARLLCGSPSFEALIKQFVDAIHPAARHAERVRQVADRGDHPQLGVDVHMNRTQSAAKRFHRKTSVKGSTNVLLLRCDLKLHE